MIIVSEGKGQASDNFRLNLKHAQLLQTDCVPKPWDSLGPLQESLGQRSLRGWDGVKNNFSQLSTLRVWSRLFNWPFFTQIREGISFPNFVERSIPELPLSKLCAVPFTLQNRALFEGEQRAKRCREKERKRGGQPRGQTGKRTRKNKSVKRVKLIVPVLDVLYFYLSWSPSRAEDNHGAWSGFINCLAARNLVLNFPLFL